MPSLFVLPVYCTPVASFAIRISAPGTVPPVGSSTRPLMVPFGDCPDKQPAKMRLTNPKRPILRSHMGLLLPGTNCVPLLQPAQQQAEDVPSRCHGRTT